LSTYCVMAQKPLAILLVLSWMIFSGVDMLEDLESHSTPFVSSSSTAAKRVKFANDNVELANYTSIFFQKLFRRVDLESTSCTMLAAKSVDSSALRSHKDNCVFLI
jgi:hypothetical protein